MMLVETTGPFTLVDTDGTVIEGHRPTVVRKTNFINIAISRGQINVLADNVDKTDNEFRDYWRECNRDRDMAIAAFLSKPEDSTPKPAAEELVDTPKPRRGRKPSIKQEDNE